MADDRNNTETESSGGNRESKYACTEGMMTLAVIVLALDEEKTICRVIEEIPKSIPGIDSIKVIVVDDGSTDQTADMAQKSGAFLVSHPITRGVGAAFATGIDEALRRQADIIVNIDADGQFSPADIPSLISPVLKDGFGFSTCTRFSDSSKIPAMPRLKYWGNRMMCKIINWIIGRGTFTDVSCGFRAYSRETALRLNLFGNFTYTQESFIDLAGKGVSMTEVPLDVRGTREFGKSRVASSLWRYGFNTVPIIARALRDVQPLKFFGTIALSFVICGVALLGFVGVWWLIYSQTSPWTSFVTLGTASGIIGLILGVISLIADQIGRGRKIQEQLLYFERLRYYKECARQDRQA